MTNPAQDLLTQDTWIRSKKSETDYVVLRWVPQNELPDIQKRLQALQAIQHPSIAIPILKQYTNGEYYLEEPCLEIPLSQIVQSMDTNAKLQLASRLCHLVESLLMLLDAENKYHGNICIESFSISIQNKIMIGGLSMKPNSVPDMELLDRLILSILKKHNHSDQAIRNFLDILRDPLPAFQRPLQMRNAIRRLLVGKKVSQPRRTNAVTTGILLKQALENLNKIELQWKQVSRCYEIARRGGWAERRTGGGVQPRARAHGPMIFSFFVC